MGSASGFSTKSIKRAAKSPLGARHSRPAASEACSHVIVKSAFAWRANEGDYRDDITAIVVYLKDLLPIL